MDFKKSSKIIDYLKSFNFYNVVSFYVIWYLCILGAAFHFEKSAISICMVLVLVHFTVSKKKVQDFLYLIAFVMIGFIVDKLFLAFHVLKYPEDTLVWNVDGVPLWILMLYIGFSTTMNHSLLFVSKHPLKSFILGGMGGAFSYYLASLRLIVDFPLGLFSYGIIGLYWGTLMGIAGPIQKIISKRLN